MADTDLLKALRRGAHNIHSIGPVQASDLLTQAADALELHHPVVDPLSGHISLVTPPRRDLLDPRLLSHHITPDADLRSACWLALERLESALARVENLEVEHRKARATIDRQGTELGELRRLGPIKRTLEERTAAIPHDLLSPEQRARVRDWIRSTLSSRRAGVPFKCSCPQGCADRLAMRAAHGTPEQFIVAISAAGAELSIAEKDIAVARYCDEWAAAPAGPVDLALAIDAQLRQDGCDPHSATQAEFKRAWETASAPDTSMREFFRMPPAERDAIYQRRFAVSLSGDPATLAKLGLDPQGVGVPEGYLVHPSMAPYFQTSPERFVDQMALGDPPPNLVTMVSDISDPREATCTACEGEQFEGAICDVCGDRVELLPNGDGTYRRVYHSPEEIAGMSAADELEAEQYDAEICLSTPIGAPSLAIAEQFDAEARAAAEEPGTPGDMMEHISDFERCYEPIDDPDEYP